MMDEDFAEIRLGSMAGRVLIYFIVMVKLKLVKGKM